MAFCNMFCNKNKNVNINEITNNENSKNKFFSAKTLFKVASLTVAFSMFSGVTAFAASSATINGNNVNVRKEAKTNAIILTQFEKGTKIVVDSVNGDWAKIQYLGENSFGYIHKDFVDMSANAPVSAPQVKTVATTTSLAPATKTGSVNSTNVNIRKAPNTTGEIIGKATTGEKYGVYTIENDFYVIEYKGTKAYIFRDFFEVEKPKEEVIQSAATKTVEEKVVAALPVVSQAAPSVIANPEVVIGLDDEVTKSYLLIAEESQNIPAEQENVTEDFKPFGVVIAETGLNFRETPTPDGNIHTKIPYNTIVDIVEVGKNWHKVNFNGITAYVSADFIKLKDNAEKEVELEKKSVPAANSGKGSDVIAYAKQFLGTPYVWAGTNLNSGVDCSGFVYAVMRDNGISLNRSSREQVKNGTQISKEELQAGDLVFFDTNGGTNNGNISHVGIYIGNGEFIHSSSSRKSYAVTISSLNEDYYIRNYVASTRVLS